MQRLKFQLSWRVLKGWDRRTNSYELQVLLVITTQCSYVGKPAETLYAYVICFWLNNYGVLRTDYVQVFAVGGSIYVVFNVKCKSVYIYKYASQGIIGIHIYYKFLIHCKKDGFTTWTNFCLSEFNHREVEVTMFFVIVNMLLYQKVYSQL